MAISQQVEMSAPHDELTAPLLFLSSEGVGWDDLTVRAYHEPREIEGCIDPVVPDTAVVLLTHSRYGIHVANEGPYRVT